MVKHTQTIRRQQLTNCFSVFDHFLKLVLKGLREKQFLRYFSELNMTVSCFISLVSSIILFWMIDASAVVCTFFFCLFLYFIMSFLFYSIFDELFFQNAFQTFRLRRLQVRSYYLIFSNVFDKCVCHRRSRYFKNLGAKTEGMV